MSLGEDEARNGIGERFREIIAIFYADDGLLASRSPEQLQSAIDLCADLFARAGLLTNVLKTKAMTFVPGKIRTRWSRASYLRCREGLELRKQWEQRMVSCNVCVMELRACLLDEHLAS